MKSRTELEKILRGAIKPVERVGVTEWSEKYGRLPSDSAEPGRYRTDRTPYMRQVMNSFTQPDIKRIVVKSAAQVGKAIDCLTPIATPDGFKLMRDIEVGDKVFDERGEVCNVTGVSPIQYNRPCYEITFSDGATIVADGEHLWQIGDAILKTTELEVGMALPDVILTDALRRVMLAASGAILREQFNSQKMKCAYCGREYEGHNKGRNRVCCMRCRELWKIKQRANNPEQTAAENARQRAARQNPPQECPQCGESFIPKKGNQKYCSLKCQKKVLHRREYEKRKGISPKGSVENNNINPTSGEPPRQVHSG